MAASQSRQLPRQSGREKLPTGYGGSHSERDRQDELEIEAEARKHGAEIFATDGLKLCTACKWSEYENLCLMCARPGRINMVNGSVIWTRCSVERADYSIDLCGPDGREWELRR